MVTVVSISKKDKLISPSLG